MRHTIVTYNKAKEFIESLDRTRKARVDKIYDLFEEYGRFLPSKYLKKIGKNIWELRPGDVRLFLTIKDNNAFVVHGIYKKAQKIPKKDIELAEKRIRLEVG